MGSLLTLILFLAGRWLYGKKPLLIFVPVFFAVVGCALFIQISGMSYDRYMEENEVLTFFLGPAVVALGVLLFKHLRTIQSLLKPLLFTVIAGSFMSVSMVAVLSVLLRLPATLAASLLPMGITTPIAIEVTVPLGGDPSITSVVVIMIGLLGNIMGPVWVRWMRIRDHAASGVSIGMVSHGIGTARAIQMGETIGLFSGLAMCINGVITVFTAPLVFSLINH